ncbi:peptidase domain-containing ABC transporter [Chryseobacterium sp. RP-3-3]|uniref:Peptidase domain-containing ABC transporter n=1 Tax=Chryseobacterium antibioticum TaxID=2728847 RepID=A0A7Y0AMI4_9FLAO|nr:peptidase domain-containing ABC transporter [Chryseobacterium antibioticum]NML70071.1 peptidase domain-containing ABC transporter [Chryseobacterium antibioticum]
MENKTIRRISHYFTGKQYPFFRQLDTMDCGPTCLKMLTAYYGKELSLNHLRDLCDVRSQGTSVSGITHAAEKLGLKTLAAKLSLDILLEKAPLPCILHWDHNHFVVLWNLTEKHAYVGNPALGKNMRYTIHDFMEHWNTPGQGNKGIAIFTEQTETFSHIKDQPDPTVSLFSLLKRIEDHKSISFVIGALLAATLLTLAIPLLTQAVVDRAISRKDVGILSLICAGQLVLFTGRILTDFFRSRILFKLGMTISIKLIYEFVDKLMQLKLSFFEYRSSGDNLQRIYDNQRIEEFLTKNCVSAGLSIIILMVNGGLLCYYNWKLFTLFLAASTVSVLWTHLFEEKRRRLDQRTFSLLANAQRHQIETFEAMTEIRLTGAEEEKNQLWKTMQEETYKVKMENLKLDQRIQGVALFINETTGVLTTFLTASLVINGSLTLGAMLAITYMYGSLNGTVNQLSDFIRSMQTAKFSLQRISEVENEETEDAYSNLNVLKGNSGSIELLDVSFRYGKLSPDVLNNISLKIPAGKVTAIVGMSGSGKTTLLKLLLKFFHATQGIIIFSGQDLKMINAKSLRRQCGAVMQDSFLFTDTIAGNIWLGSQEKDMLRVQKACHMVNMQDFIESLPFSYETQIGSEGIGLSEGQKQRLLIARLIYREPDYIFLDEATNSLDASNERMIVENLNSFFKGRTVVIVAHRLSTVVHADHIIVLHKGHIVEQGTHETLTQSKGAYYNLVKNQLELGK